ncbi:MAG: hypothetical protein WC820_04110 [Spirochaetales bacterium]|jgi:hypothetical protein
MISAAKTHGNPRERRRYGKALRSKKPIAEFATDLLKKKAEKRKIHFSYLKAGLQEKSAAWSVTCNPNIISI